MSRSYRQTFRHAQVYRLSERRKLRRIVSTIRLTRALSARVLAVLFPGGEK